MLIDRIVEAAKHCAIAVDENGNITPAEACEPITALDGKYNIYLYKCEDGNVFVAVREDFKRSASGPTWESLYELLCGSIC